jgi:hypothetical protein
VSGEYVLENVSGDRKVNVTNEWRKLRNQEFHDSCSPHYKASSFTRQVAPSGKLRNIYSRMLIKNEQTKLHGNTSRRYTAHNTKPQSDTQCFP